jgi:ribosomal protein S24E
MKIYILSKNQNHLMRRKEITFNVNHQQNGGTPSRTSVRMQLSSLLKTKPELVFLKNFKTKKGTMLSSGEANVYNSITVAQKMEPKHVLARNKLIEIKTKKIDKSKESTEKKEKE